VPCLRATLSKSLGLAIIAGSLTVKFPQIIKLWRNQSAQGMSFISVLADLAAITTATSYSFVKGFPFSAWGEGLFLMLQTVTIAFLVLHFNVSTILAFSFLAGYISVFYTMMSGLTPINILWSLQTSSVPVLIFGKLMQAFTNYKNGGTGQLSAATCVMLFFGSSARVFTSIQETGDTTIIVTYLLATLGNAVIVAQFIYYSMMKPVKKTKVQSKKKR
ncbi:hypothetical protein AAG570_001797, partial [Ranatra chinensis]